MQPVVTTSSIESDLDLRAQAIKRLEKKRDFRRHLLVFVMVNALLWTLWSIGFIASGAWFPWPLFAFFGWGIGLAFHAWDAYGRLPFTEDQVNREEARLRGYQNLPTV
jgi:fatty acid desaturase